MSLGEQYYKPKEQLQLDVRANQDGLVALSAVDAAIFTLRPNYRDPVSMVTPKSYRFIRGSLRRFVIKNRHNNKLMALYVDSDFKGRYFNFHVLTTDRMNFDPQVLRHIEQSDLGCGGGGGKDSADVFRLAGLTFITNANTAPSTSSTSVSK